MRLHLRGGRLLDPSTRRDGPGEGCSCWPSPAFTTAQPTERATSAAAPELW